MPIAVIVAMPSPVVASEDLRPPNWAALSVSSLRGAVCRSREV
jgi:hypothetical protein